MEAENGNSVRLYKYRWTILAIFCLFAAINFMQFLQYSIIGNIVSKYYNDADTTLVDLTGLTFMICSIIFCLPGNYLIDKYDLKKIALVSSGLTTVGNLLKLASVSPDRIYVVLLSQTLCALGQVLIFSIPTKLASTWFGPHEVSTACALAVFGTQIGVAIGSVVPSAIVTNSDNLDDIGDDFYTMHIVYGSLSCAFFVAVLFFFKARPDLPPSQSQVNIVENDETLSIGQILKTVFRNRNFWLILIVFGISNGVWTSFGIIINTVYLHYFPNSESELGVITCISVIMGGCIGSVIFGFALDKWHHFKVTSFISVMGSALTYIFVILSLEEKVKLATYFTFPIFAFFIASTLLIGFEFGTEVLHPIPEAYACSILNAFVYIFTIIFTLIFQALFDSIGYLNTQIVVFVLLLLDSFIIYFMKADLKRMMANSSPQ